MTILGSIKNRRGDCRRGQQEPTINSTLVNLNGAIDRTWVLPSTGSMSAFTDDTGSGRWVGT
jgi:hypothetical protein